MGGIFLKALQIARKTLLEALREPQLYGLLLLFPAVLVLVYYVAFGGTSQGTGVGSSCSSAVRGKAR